MLIESLWIENFRSIRKLELKGLGAFNVFYGENGAGKSNVLAALNVLFDAMAQMADQPRREVQNVIQRSDVRLPLDPAVGWTIGARLLGGAPVGGTTVPEWFEFEIQAVPYGRPNARITRAATPDADLLANLGTSVIDPVVLAQLARFASAFRLEPAVRALGMESQGTLPAELRGASRVAFLLRAGRLKQALVEAVTSPDLDVRAGLKRMQKVFEGDPLKRPAFDPIFDPGADSYELNEVRRAADGTHFAIPVDLAGLGIQQVYAVMAGIFLGGASIVAVEEPEAHLHPRTTGLQLRTLLKRAVDEGHIDQLFIATHSNLFDLDPTGYFYVRNDEKLGTVVERRTDFAQLDRDVFWEPGPARHALTDMLRYLPADAPVFKRPDGTSITAAEMLGLLQADDPAAIAFVDDVQSTAVHTVQRLAQRKK